MLDKSSIGTITLSIEEADLIARALSKLELDDRTSVEDWSMSLKIRDKITQSFMADIVEDVEEEEDIPEELKVFTIYPCNRRYGVNKLGDVKDLTTGKLRHVTIGSGRPCVSLITAGGKSENVSVAVIVARTFGIISTKDKYYSIDFIDGNIHNCKLDNLRYTAINPRHRKVKTKENESDI